eukprot:5454056-Pleurochrysis_carterae.AAC.1
MSTRPMPSEGRRIRVLSDTRLWASESRPNQPQRLDSPTSPKDVLKRAHGLWKKLRPKVKNRPTKGKQRADVKGISSFPPQKALSGSLGIPSGTQRHKRKQRSTTALAERAREVLWRRCMSVGLEASENAFVIA